MERVKVHRELIQHLPITMNDIKGLMYVACLHVREGLCTISLLLCQQDKILNIEDLILMSTVSKSQLCSVTLNVNETLLILESVF